MKRLRFPALIAVAIIAIGSAFAVNVKPAKEIKVFTAYHYDGPTQTIDDLNDPANWYGGDPSCGETGSDICTITYAGDRAAFDTYVSGFTTKAAMLTVASHRKN